MKTVAIYAVCLDFPDDLWIHELPVSPVRLEQINRIRHSDARKKSLVAELLLCWAVRQLRPAGIPIPPIRQVSEYGKPYFAENPAFQFSISHSMDWVVLAVADVPVGVDIEFCSVPNTRIVKRFFHEEEYAYFHSLPEAERKRAFYSLWVLKESAVKALGTGMHRPFRSFSVSLPELHLVGIPGAVKLALPPFCDPCYQLGLCTRTDEEIRPVLQTVTAQEILHS